MKDIYLDELERSMNMPGLTGKRRGELVKVHKVYRRWFECQTVKNRKKFVTKFFDAGLEI